MAKVHPEVLVDDVPGRAVDEYMCHPADLAEGSGERLLLLLGVEAPVRRVRKELLRGFVAVADDPVAPGSGRRHLMPGPCFEARTE